MKKLFVTLFLSLGLVGSAYATDLIALATNGKVHENSLGVRTLNHQEMREIVGGYRPFSASWYGHTYIKQPWTNNYNANNRPQTSNQAILSNAFMNWYLGNNK